MSWRSIATSFLNSDFVKERFYRLHCLLGIHWTMLNKSLKYCQLTKQKLETKTNRIQYDVFWGKVCPEISPPLFVIRHAVVFSLDVLMEVLAADVADRCYRQTLWRRQSKLTLTVWPHLVPALLCNFPPALLLHLNTLIPVYPLVQSFIWAWLMGAWLMVRTQLKAISVLTPTGHSWGMWELRKAGLCSATWMPQALRKKSACAMNEIPAVAFQTAL